jgi:hypothetical protein
MGRNVAYGYNYHYLNYSRSNPLAVGEMPYFAHEASIEMPAEMLCIADSQGTGTVEPYLSASEADDVNRILNHGYSLDPPQLPTLPATRTPSTGTSRAWSATAT